MYVVVSGCPEELLDLWEWHPLEQVLLSAIQFPGSSGSVHNVYVLYVASFYKKGESAAQRELRRHARVPTCHAISIWVKNFEETVGFLIIASVMDKFKTVSDTVKLCKVSSGIFLLDIILVYIYRLLKPTYIIKPCNCLPSVQLLLYKVKR